MKMNINRIYRNALQDTIVLQNYLVNHSLSKQFLRNKKYKEVFGYLSLISAEAFFVYNLFIGV